MVKRASSTDKRFGGRAFRYASSGRTSSLKSLVESWISAAQSLGSETPSDVDFIVKTELALLRDRKGRTLLHLAAKSGEKSMISYLLGMGLPRQATDTKGNSAAHWLLKSCLKRQSRLRRKASKRGRGNSSPEVVGHSSLYTECCQLLGVLVAGRTDALTTQNDDGECSTDLLQRLWQSASTADRERGDKILMTLMSSDGTLGTSLRDSPCEGDSVNRSSVRWSPEADTMEHGYTWEDYFSGFSDQESRSHLETIAEEFQRRRTTNLVPPSKVSRELPQSSFGGASSDFHRRHERAMFQRSQKQEATPTSLQTYEQFRNEWLLFTSSSKRISRLSDVTWPPVCEKITSGESRAAMAEMRIGLVLRFVDRSTSVLRKLQIDWHPDRFLSRFGERIEKDTVKNLIMERVNAISQLFNTSMDALRKETGDRIE